MLHQDSRPWTGARTLASGVVARTLAGETWDQVFATVVIPQLKSTIVGPRRAASPAGGPWHAQYEAGSKLAALLLALDPGDTARYIDGLVDEGAGLLPIYKEVFEPAARCLGGMWEEDLCNEFGLTLAMSRLQLEARRLAALLIHKENVAQPGHSILLAQQPGEPHGVNSAMSSELFLRDGWDVSCEMSTSDRMLGELLHNQWFDVLDLSLSAAIRRDQQLPAMRVTIRAARAASLNPALAVIVDGRCFFERPQVYKEVGADVGCATVTLAVPAAQQLLSVVASRARQLQSQLTVSD